MNGLMKAATVFAAGAAAMYFLDPVAGRRRRALSRDKTLAAGRDLQDSAREAGRRVSNRAKGAMAEAGSALDRASDDAPVSDGKLEAQIRSRLGHMVARPGDIDVAVHDGHVVLSGTASEDEVASVTRELAGLSGVSDVENRMH